MGKRKKHSSHHHAPASHHLGDLTEPATPALQAAVGVENFIHGEAMAQISGVYRSGHGRGRPLLRIELGEF